MKIPAHPVQLPLNNGHVAIIDQVDLHKVMHYQWRAVRYQRCYYARSTIRQDGKPTQISMHRLCAKTPAQKICHHRNRNTLDNRRSNLLNLSKQDHHFLHLNDTILIKYR